MLISGQLFGLPSNGEKLPASYTRSRLVVAAIAAPPKRGFRHSEHRIHRGKYCA